MSGLCNMWTRNNFFFPKDLAVLKYLMWLFIFWCVLPKIITNIIMLTFTIFVHKDAYHMYCPSWDTSDNAYTSKFWDFSMNNCAYFFRYWDTRQPNPVHTQQLPDRCYALTVRHPLLVVGTADRNLVVFNLQSPQVSFYFIWWLKFVF